MAGNIKGITIEFRGETTKLDKALRDINNNTKSLDKELKQVSNALKFNPTSVELWRQKQQLLTEKVEQTKDKLKALKDAQAQMDASGVDKNSKEYRELQRQIITTENQVKNFEGQLRAIGNVKLKALSEEFKQVGTKLESTGQALRGISTAAAGVVAGLGAISYKAGTAADDLNTLSKVTGIGTDELQKYSYAADLVDVSVETIAKANKKLTKNAYEAANGSSSQAEAFERLGVAVKDSNGELRSSEDIFQDVLKGLGEMTNETERDAIAQTLMGKSAAELNPLIEDGGETYKMVADTLKKYNLDYIDQETLDKANEFNDSIDTMKLLGSVAFAQVGSQLAAYLAPALEKVVDLVGKFADWLSNLSPETLTLIASIAGFVAVLAPLLIGLGKVAFGISSIINLIGVVGPAIGALSAGTLLPIIGVIAAVVAAGVLLYKNWDRIKETAQKAGQKIKEIWNSVKTAVVNTWNSLKTSVSNAAINLKNAVVNTWTSLKNRVSNLAKSIYESVSAPFVKAKETVSNLIGNIKDFVSRTWDSISEKTSRAWDKITDAMVSPFTWAKEKIDAILDKITGWFPIDIGRIFSSIKLPHLSVEWSTLTAFGKSIKFPSGFDVDWYKNGGIFDSPSIIGVGEAGSEAVVPLNKFWDKLDNLAASQTAPVINIYPGANQSAREIAREVEKILVQQQKQKVQAYGI